MSVIITSKSLLPVRRDKQTAYFNSVTGGGFSGNGSGGNPPAYISIIQGTPVAGQIATFHDASSIEGRANLTYNTNNDLNVGVEATKNIYLQPGDEDINYLNPGKIILGGPNSSLGNIVMRAETSISSLLQIDADGGIYLTVGSNSFWLNPGYILSTVSKFIISDTAGPDNAIVQGADISGADAYKLTIQGGDALSGDFKGGDLHLQCGAPHGTGDPGKVYIGTGSAGTNPLPEAGASDTCVLTYNPTTGQVSWMTI